MNVLVAIQQRLTSIESRLEEIETDQVRLCERIDNAEIGFDQSAMDTSSNSLPAPSHGQDTI